MATAIHTPIKSHTRNFSSKQLDGRAPLTPSPHARQAGNSSPKPSPFTPEQRGSSKEYKSTYNGGNLFSKSIPARPAGRGIKESPKSNIARHAALRGSRGLELGISEFSLVSTNVKSPGSGGKRERKTTRAKVAKTTISYASSDRFIPSRGSSGIATAGSGKLDGGERPKPVADGSSVLANGAHAFDVGGRGSEDDITGALEGLNIEDEVPSTTYAKPSPNTVAYQDSLASACGVNIGHRILEFKPAAPESSKPIDLRSQYNRPLKSANSASAQFRRRVATAPERVLDAPGLVDDYYLNLLDWSSGNQVAIGLERNVYVWSASSGSVSSLLECPEDTYVSSVKWSGDGAYVGVGLGSGEVQIWDVEEGTKLRSMFGHDSRVGVMGWNKHTLSTGARSGLVFNHDVRIAAHKTAELISHTSEVCGLEWRADGQQLATGGNDNLVTIWDARSLTVPKFAKTNHKAAVKALAWCPWQPNLLATGGGSYDRHIHFWNSTSGARVNSIDTGSQVTSLRWSPHYREIVSTSGFPDNSLSIWSYPTLVKNVEIPAHETRVLHSTLSPDGQMLATAAADESLKFWKVFEKTKKDASASGAGAREGKAEMMKSVTIR